MERLTQDGTGKYAACNIPDECTGQCGKCEHFSKIKRKLREYENLEEQGLLLKLPCKVGDIVYEVQESRKRIQPMEIISVYIGRMGELFFYWELKDGIGIYKNVRGFGMSEIGKHVFLTYDEAEETLMKVRG